jgi:ADP-ribose pyrophosphatase YjhB (NUDIX family)
MPSIVVNVAVIKDKQILLTKRNDFEVWCLPSGGVEDGESVVQAAIRETKEETGIDVKLESLVGIYSRIGKFPNIHAVLFIAKPIGGNINTQPGETIEVKYFSFDKIPEELSLGHRQRIDDAISEDQRNLVVTQEIVFPDGEEITSSDITEARNLPRDSRKTYYQKLINKSKILNNIELVGKKSNSS